MTDSIYRLRWRTDLYEWGKGYVSADAVKKWREFMENWKPTLCWVMIKPESSGRWFTYTRSNKKWAVGCFYGTGEELIKKAYADSKVSGKCYEAIVRAVETIESAKAEAKGEAE